MENKILEIEQALSQLDDMTLEEIHETEEYFKADFKMMDKKAKSKKTTASEKKYKNITSFRYGAMNLYSELGIHHEHEYTKTELIKLLNEKGYFEFDNNKTDFAQHEEDGTIVVTIKGSSKGARFFLALPPQILKTIEQRFQDVYKTSRTEARALVYYSDETKEYHLVYPDQMNTIASTTSDIELNIRIDNKIYYLAFDFHSHHVMGAYFSRIDDDNEKYRNICYGVFSWYGQLPTWKFRVWNGRNFKELKRHEVMY